MGKPMRRRGSVRGDRAPSRAAAWTGVLALVAGALGALPNGSGPGSDPVALLAWLALLAPAAGFACGSAGLALWPWSVSVVGGWCLLLASAAAGREDWPPGLAWAAGLLLGMFAAGHGLGRLLPGRELAGAGVLLLLAGLAAGLPGRGGAGGRSWGERDPAWGLRIYAASPVALMLETAGVDWARHPAMYDPAGTEWFSDPGRRTPPAPGLAAGVALVVGCVAGLLARGVARSGAAAGVGPDPSRERS